MLTDNHKKNRVATAQTFLAHYEDQGDDFLDCIVTGDKTWVSHHTPENKQQSMQWRHTHSPTAKKSKISPSNQKIMATIFWDRKGPLLIHFFASRRHHQCCCSL
jgi:hypothetical protein